MFDSVKPTAKLSALNRDDCSFELELSMFHQGFHSSGKAFFGKKDLCDFNIKIACLAEAINLNDSVTLSGGFFDDEGSIIIEEHLKISFLYLESKRLFVMDMATFIPEFDESFSLCGRGGCMRMLVDFSGIMNFSDSLKKIVDGKLDEITFDMFISNN